MMIEEQRARQLIEQTQGKIFRADFTKRDGEPRTMIARVGVTVGVSGVGMSYNPDERGLRPVFDMQAHGWRMIDLTTVGYFQCGDTREGEKISSNVD